ncbi:Gfo/Idh/MocA family protein [Aquabacterium sp.]|uniref:Gfo/Idh/MocA family protein n=1 Tax=Aquabacterium sp. TaxID=1872578 RepID=UPI002C2DF6A7|nr:Gfo/Idh/MocA family oxidoreductase [Aquabacterium sp.]HSW03916.1 Gfo/Idh/MocA family oxidoreductase [Aquabacterium sp.]
MRPLLRVGLVGAGWVTQHHLPAWQAIGDRARVVAITDPDAARARERAEVFGIAGVFGSLPEMLAAGGIDALDIAAPREAHAGLVRLAAAHGVPVLCQKPLAPTLAEAESLASEVHGHIRLMVHENWRFRPVYRLAAQWLREGRIGTVLQAQMTLLSSGLLPDAQGRLPALARQPFIATLDRALVMEILIHHIDTLRFLLGELQLVQARLGRACEAMRGEDRAAISFETSDGAPVHLLANLCVHGEPPAPLDALLLIGERGTIRLDGNTLHCSGAAPAEQVFDLAAGYAASYAATIAHFVDALASGQAFETDPQDNLRTLALVENIYR